MTSTGTDTALEAMQAFRSAEIALARNDYAGAERLANAAVDFDPAQSEYVALLAWIRSFADRDDAVDDALLALSGVLKRDEANVRARLYRAKLYARTHRVTDALADLDIVLAADPRHREALADRHALRTRLSS